MSQAKTKPVEKAPAKKKATAKPSGLVRFALPGSHQALPQRAAGDIVTMSRAKAAALGVEIPRTAQAL